MCYARRARRKQERTLLAYRVLEECQMSDTSCVVASSLVEGSPASSVAPVDWNGVPIDLD